MLLAAASSAISSVFLLLSSQRHAYHTSPRTLDCMLRRISSEVRRAVTSQAPNAIQTLTWKLKSASNPDANKNRQQNRAGSLEALFCRRF
jgi:hypothetical protein